MGRLGYNLNEAAEAAGIPLRIIVNAINGGHLTARRVEDKALILNIDLQAWLETLPLWMS